MVSLVRQGFKFSTKACIIAGVTASTTILISSNYSPARADFAAAKQQIDATMTMLSGIAETGVGIVMTPFGIGFALKIASHVLRAGT